MSKQFNQNNTAFTSRLFWRGHPVDEFTKEELIRALAESINISDYYYSRLTEYSDLIANNTLNPKRSFFSRLIHA